MAGPDEARPKLFSLAVLCLLLGLASLSPLLIVTGLPALLLGLFCLRQIHRSEGHLRGVPLAIAGMILGGLGSLVSITGFFLGMAQEAREKANRVVCQNNLRLIGEAVLTSKLIDGTFPDYVRVIPVANDKELVVEKKEFEQAVDRVSTVSSERGRAVKLSLNSGKLVLSVTNPDSGSASEELEVEYAAEPLDIGFNSRYLLDIAAQLDGEAAVLKLADPGSPTLIQERDDKGALYVLMPMRV